jgi:hypothetical protein
MSNSLPPAALSLDLVPIPGRPSRAEVAGKRLADRLLSDGLLIPVQREHALEYARWRGVPIEDALVDLRILSERRLLEHLATVHRTRYVSTEQLARASIPRRLLDLLPVRTAEQIGVFPVQFDDRSATLSVVTGDPGDESVRREVRMASLAARGVTLLAARPAAVRAAIEYHYRGNRRAFGAMSRPSGVMEAVSAPASHR